MKNAQQERETVLKLVELYHQTWQRRDAGREEVFRQLIHEHSSVFGTGAQEMMEGLNEILEAYRRERTAIEEPPTPQIHWLKCEVIGDVAVCRLLWDISISDGASKLEIKGIRGSLIWKKTDGEWKIIHEHASMPYSIQVNSEFYPIEELKARNQELERLVQEKTRELRLAKIAAEEANEAKSTFLSTVSHELRTPLTSIIGFSKLNKRNLEEKVLPEIKENATKAQKSAQRIAQNLEIVEAEGLRLTALINDLLDLAKIESGKVDWRMEPISPTELIERAAATTAALFEQKPPLKLIKELPDDLPLITADRDRLLQVLINLISNAVKFTDSGYVKIGVKSVGVENSSDGQAGSLLLLFVEDTGAGIPPEHLDRIFEKFQQVDDNQAGKPKGTGLGLPICKEIVEHHGGQIWVESKIGKGSTFFLTIPFAEK